jgi:Tfp pilus assembly protein PilN
MIFEINLLKDRVKAQKKKSFLRTIFYVEIFIFILTLIFLSSYRIILYYKLEDTQRKLVMLNEDMIFLSKEGATIENLKEINNKYLEITSQLSTINKLTQDRVLFSRKLKGISQVLPENMWIDKFYIKEQEKMKVLFLSGFVRAERDEAFKKVQLFMKDLEQEPLFKEGISNMQLSSISKPMVALAGQITEFEITCNLIPK